MKKGKKIKQNIKRKIQDEIDKLMFTCEECGYITLERDFWSRTPKTKLQPRLCWYCHEKMHD